jgi:hypothetical protein
VSSTSPYSSRVTLTPGRQIVVFVVVIPPSRPSNCLLNVVNKLCSSAYNSRKIGALSPRTAVSPTMAAQEDPDLLRILIATDNHLGVHEKDQVRKDDAFITFREIFEIAKQQNVDAVFLGGDLFDVNKPSRETMVRTMEILQEYCMNDRPVQLEVLSDQTVNFPR